MVNKCPCCSRLVPEDSVYCPYCGSGIAYQAKTPKVYVASFLLLITCASSIVFLILSTRALLYVFTWYPSSVAQEYYIYIQILLVLSLCQLFFGVFGATFSYRRLNYKWALASTAFCAFLGGGVWVITLIVPRFPLWSSILFYFLPQFVPPLIGTILLFSRKPEFKR